MKPGDRFDLAAARRLAAQVPLEYQLQAIVDMGVGIAAACAKLAIEPALHNVDELLVRLLSGAEGVRAVRRRMAADLEPGTYDGEGHGTG